LYRKVVILATERNSGLSQRAAERTEFEGNLWISPHQVSTFPKIKSGFVQSRNRDPHSLPSQLPWPIGWQNLPLG
jgi:hypothetical protein